MADEGQPGPAVEARTRARLARLLGELAVLAAYVCLALAQSRITGDLTTHCYGGGRGDPGQDGWVLARVTSQLLREPWRPFEGNIYYPSHSSVLYKDPLLGPAVLVLPLKALGANPVLLYNAAILLSLIVASIGCYLLARRLGAARRAAFLAGVVVPYTSQQMARLFHLNLMAIPFFPFLLLGLVELLESPRLRAALLAGLSFALQAATSGYHAFSAALLALVTGAWGLPRARGARPWLWSAAALAVAALVLQPYVSGFGWVREHDARMQRGAEVAVVESLDLMDVFASRSYVWNGLLPQGHAFFPGLVVLLLAGRALRDLRRDAYVRLLALIVLATFAFALGPQIRFRGRALAPGPFALAARAIPWLDAMRHPHTLAVPGLMALGILAALGLSRSRLSRSRAGCALVSLAAGVETLGDAPARRPAPLDLPGVYADVARLEAAQARRGTVPGAVLEVPFSDRAYLWRAAFHDLRIVNGAGSFEPERYQVLRQHLGREWKGRVRDMEGSRSLEYLKTWFPVRYALLHGSRHARWRGFIDATPRSFVLLHTSAGGERLYRLRRGGRGPELARAFRDDQLRAGRIEARLAGTPGARLEARLNGVPLGEAPAPAHAPRGVAWSVPPALVQHGLNMLVLRVAPGAPGSVELEDVDEGGACLTCAEGP